MKRTKVTEISLCFGIAIILLIFSAYINASVAKRITPTVDETAHVTAGYTYWKANEAKIYRKNPPLVKLLISYPLIGRNKDFDKKSYMEIRNTGGAWAPWKLADNFMKDNSVDYFRLFFKARKVVVFMAFMLGLIIYSLSARIFGHRGALLSVAVYAFSPNMLAHSSIATVDIGFTLFFLFAVHEAMRLNDSFAGWPIFSTGIALGLALVSKFTALFLLPYLGLLALISMFFRKELPGHKAKGRVGSELIYLLLTVVVAWCTMWGVYKVIHSGSGFTGVLLEGKAPQEKKSPIEHIQKRIPLPENYVLGFYEQYRDTKHGEFKDGNYFDGKWYTGPNWKYFPAAFLLKTPLAELALIAMSLLYLVYLLLRRESTPATARSLKYNYLPILIIVLPMMFLSSLNLGIRYILPVYPLFYISIGALGMLPTFSSRLFWIPIIAVIVWLGFTTVKAYPNYLPYFNEVAGGMEKGDQYLLDSNIDWGQDLHLVKKYMKDNNIDKIGLAYFGHVDPNLYGINYEILMPGYKGIAAVSVNYAYGYPYVITYTDPWMTAPRGAFELLVKGKQPIARLGGSILVYNME